MASENPLRDILVWMIKALVALYALIIVSGVVISVFGELDTQVLLALLGSITALMTSAIGGLFVAVAKQSDAAPIDPPPELDNPPLNE